MIDIQIDRQTEITTLYMTIIRYRVGVHIVQNISPSPEMLKMFLSNRVGETNIKKSNS